MSDIPSLKTWLPSVVRFEVGFIVKVVNFLQFAKALPLISVTESGSTNVTIEVPLRQAVVVGSVKREEIKRVVEALGFRLKE